MNIKNEYSRRKFLELGSKVIVSLPLLSVVGCEIKNSESLSPEESLKRVIFLIGPWSKSEEHKAEYFVNRFIKFKYADPYLRESSKIIQSLADHFPTNNIAVKEINLKKLSREEQKLLKVLTKQLYSFVEVRYYVSKEPPWSQYQGNNWHTRIPDPDRS